MHSTRICPALMPLKCCWRCSCTTNLKKLSAIACAVSWLKVTSCVSSSFFLNRFIGLLSCSVAALLGALPVCVLSSPMLRLPPPANAPFAVNYAAFARFFGGNANSMRCFTTMPSDANAQSFAARSSTVRTSSREELSAASLRCCSLRRSMIHSCSCLYVYGIICLGVLNVPKSWSSQLWISA